MTVNAYDADIGELYIAQRKEVVFIENDVADWQTIAAQAGAGREVIVLDAAGDGLQQMAQALAGRSGIDALHVVTHGAEGKLDLGTLALDSTTVEQRGSLLASIGASLAPHADILLYGCDVGAGQGAAFVDRLAIATGADVAASANPTGAASLGGDWNLEIAHGSIGTAPVVDAALAAQYSHLLAITAPTTLTFASAPLTNYMPGPNDDFTYAIPGQPAGYWLDVDGAADGIENIGGGFLTLSPNAVETSVTLSLANGAVFTPTYIDLSGGSGSYGQQVKFTGKDAQDHTVTSTTLYVPSGHVPSTWLHDSLVGFNDIAKLIITPVGTGATLAPLQIDNLVLASAHLPPPAVDSVWSPTADRAYTVGATIVINVDFDQALTIDTTGGTPTLTLETGAVDRNATYVGSTASNRLVFNYVVQPGDTSGDLDYASTGALALNGATVKAADTGLAVNTTLDTPGSLFSLAGIRSIVIDTTAPDKPAIPVLAAASDTGTSSGDQITNDATPTFTGTIANSDVVSVTLYNNLTVVGNAQVVSGHYTVAPTAAVADGAQPFAIVATDAAGNTSDISGSVLVNIDTAAPTVTVTSAATAPLKIGESTTVTFTFSEDPGAFAASDVTVGGGTLGAMSGTGTTRTATFTPAANTDNGAAAIDVHAGFFSDVAGNGNAAGTLTIAYDTKAPTLTIVADKPTVTAGETATITFAFSEDPGSSFTADDVAVSGGALGALSGSGTTRTATFTPDANVATGSANIVVGAGSYADAAGNTSDTGASLTLIYHTVAPPTPTDIALDSASDSGWSHTDGITNHTQLAFSGVAAANMTVRLYDGAAQIGSTIADSSGNWSITTPTLSEGAHAVVAKTVDGYGSLSAPSIAVPVVVDTTAPMLTTIASDKAALKAGETATITFTFNEDPGGTFTAADVSVSGGTLSALSGSGATRTAIFTPTADTDNGLASVSVNAASYADAAGNIGTGRTGPALTYDTLAPAASVLSVALSADSGVSTHDFLTNESVQTLSGTLSAALGTGERVQVSLDHGTSWADAAASAGSNAWSYDAVLDVGSHDIQVRVVDTAGNAGPVATQAYSLDMTRPALIISSDHTELKAGETSLISFMFTEDPGTTFTTDDITVSGGTLGPLSGTGTTRTAVFTPTLDTDAGTAVIAVIRGSFTDAAGNAGSAINDSRTIPFDTLAPAAPAAPVLNPYSDTGVSSTDGLTGANAPTIEGMANPNAFVRIYDSDGTLVGDAVANASGAWRTIAGRLADGVHAFRAVQLDAAGNVSAFSAPLVFTVDTQPPATLAAPLLAAASDSGTRGDHITKVATPTFGGKAGAFAQVTLYDTDRRTALGSVVADADGNWTITTSALADGEHDVMARQIDIVGNWSVPGQVFALTVDTTAPAAPSAPQLQAQSDTGVRGDGVTYAMPVLTGSAAAGDLVTLYDGATAVGTARAGLDGAWTIAAPGLHLGHHTLTATSTDAAGNVSAASGAFGLTLEEAPVPLVDGVRVVTIPVVLPGGGSGTQVQVPIVGADRADSGGAGGTADIPLANSAGADVLVAHVAPGYGLTATGGPVTTAADGGASLIAAIQAAGAGDAAPLAGNGQGYLAQLAGEQPLLVQTIAPVTGVTAPTGTLTLSGAGGPHVALVLQAAGMAGGAIALQDVDFAAVVGAASVVAQSGARMLAGDGAAQDFTVQSGAGTQVYAGGGNDLLRFGPAPAASAHTANGATGAATGAGTAADTAPTTTLLHGGGGDDTAVFAGARADFDVETHQGYLVVRSKAAPDAQALVVNVEHLQFSDATVAVQNDADLAPLTGLYQAVLGRQADIHGLDFWAGVHDSGTSLGAIALAMVGSSERLATHGGFTGDVGHDVGLLYAGLFDRTADAAGLAFWTQAVQHGATLAQVADAMLQSVEMVGQQGTQLDWNFSV